MNAAEMWERFCEKSGIKADYDDWAFGGAPDALAELVLNGIKTATASAYPLYEQEQEPLPKAGDYSVILNTKGEAVCIIRTTKVYVVPFREVSADHAFREGEDDRSLESWRKVHRDFFTREMNDEGLSFDEDMPVVCEEFMRVYP
ncbi:MAG: ASCH domain-containing protein [Firmicutes bacterium]|nr:ASCH domain-containing protein [Bacillota bacterium]